MEIHEIFDIVYSVNLTGLNPIDGNTIDGNTIDENPIDENLINGNTINENQINENQKLLTNTFFIRTGVNLPYSKIIEMYKEICRIVNSMGYSEPIDFLNDYFPNEDFKRVRIFKKNLELKILLNENEKEIKEVEIKNNDIKMVDEKKEVVFKDPVSKPIKIKKEIIKKEDDGEVVIPLKDRNRILKHKKMSKRFKEMEQREKEIDNKYDYFMNRSKVLYKRNDDKSIDIDDKGIDIDDKSIDIDYKDKDITIGSNINEVNKDVTTGNNKDITTISNVTTTNIIDNREILKDNPFLSNFYNDIDLKFREVMYKIYKNNKTHLKDKTKMNEEIEFLEDYFIEKLQLKKDEEEGIKKLSNAIAYLMKKLQNKIFESEEKEVIETMVYFKSKLCLFYNYYRK